MKFRERETASTRRDHGAFEKISKVDQDLNL
jgi:hypothetical protein